jgi:hypothetical protein
VSDERPALATRLEALEARVAALEGGSAARGEAPTLPADLWALSGFKARVDEPGGVLFTGAVTLPTGEHVEWQEARPLDVLLEDDPTEVAAKLSALAHPVRLMLLTAVLRGTRTATALAAEDHVATSGQLYHHLRQLVAAGWLRTTGRGRYAVPADRVVPLLTLLAAARR